MGGFQLRLADRRWERRAGLGDWVSHIRMAPQRLLPWGATATVALIAGRPTEALAILMAVLACEMLLYPLLAPAMGRLTRGGIVLLLLLMLPLWGPMSRRCVTPAPIWSGWVDAYSGCAGRMAMAGRWDGPSRDRAPPL